MGIDHHHSCLCGPPWFGDMQLLAFVSAIHQGLASSSALQPLQAVALGLLLVAGSNHLPQGSLQ
jgi:hypothetical protein